MAQLAKPGFGEMAWRPLSIRRRLLFLTMAMALASVLGAAMVVRDANRYGRAQTEQQLMETTRALSLLVDRQLGQSEALLRGLRSSPALQTGDLAAFGAQARVAAAGSGVWIVLLDPSSRQLVNTRLPPNAPLPQQTLNIAPMVRQVLSAGRTYYCDLLTGPVTRRPVLCVIVPVRTPTGGYGLAAAFEPQRLDELIAEQRLPAGWYGVLFGRDNRIISRSRDADRFRGHIARTDFIRQTAHRSESLSNGVSLDGVAVLSSAVRSPRTGWLFAASIPVDEVAGALRRSLALGVIAVTLLLALALVVAVSAARSLTGPIRQIAGDARRLGQGEPVEPRRTGVDELDQVSLALAQAGRELSALELRLSLATQAGGIGVWEWSAGDRTSWWSASFAELFGLDPAMPPDLRAAAERVFEEDRPGTAAAVRAARAGETFESMFRIEGAGGETRWLTTRGRCVADEPRRLTGICFDVTESKRLADRLAEANQRLESKVAETTADRDRTWQLSRDLFLVATPAGEVLAINPAWTELLGWREAELRRTSLRDLVHPDDQAETASRLRGFTAGTKVDRFEHRLRHERGGWHTIAWTVVAEGQRLHAVGRDVTEERAAAQKLAEAQAALHEAQKLETLGQLTGGVAHDFNNLLTPIVGSLDLLRRRFVDDRRATLLFDTAITSADRARTLVDRLLTFARRQSLRPQSVDVGGLIEGMVDLIRRSLGPTIMIDVGVAEALPPARVDPNQLELVLLNLAVNARDAMPAGGTLSIAAALDRDPPDELTAGAYVRLIVGDTGEGMDADTLRRAIEPFFSTKGVGKGTGLGLSMAHGLAAQSGGQLLLDSETGQGTRVSLWLPVAADEATPAPHTCDAEVERRAGHILLVDDDAEVRATTAAMLAELGCTVSEAASAEAALRLLGDGLAIDALVTDHVMPGMQGSELVAAAREVRAGLPALVISGFSGVGAALPVDVERLAKPFFHAELSAALGRLLGKATAPEEPS